MTMTMPAIPYLESGDRLTRAEFERRYEAMPHGTKAELIEGVVYVASPVRFATHGEPHSRIITSPGIYAAATPGVRAGDNATVRLDWANELQPDGLLRIERGASMIDATGMFKDRRSSWLKSPLAAPPRICTTNCGFIVAVVCRNTWCGWSSSSGSSGLRSTPATIVLSPPTRTLSCAAVSFRDSGSTCLRWCATTWPARSRHCSRGSPLQNTPLL